MTDTFIMPTNPTDVKKISDAVIEASNSKLRIDAERDLIKDIASRMHAEIGIPKKMFNQMVKVYHKQNYGTVAKESEEFQELYEKVMAKVDPSVD